MPDRSGRVVPRPDAPVEVQVMGRGSLDVLRARNVSRSGIGVFVPHGFEGCDLEAEVELIITLPGGRPFRAKGAIKHWTQTSGVGQHFGLEFTEMTRTHRTEIRDYVRARARDETGAD